ncbi:hypothetical protein HAX54_011375, partial [Datura stramonium]|nr:hypothetical protein [Datura stramonium]
LSFRRRWFAVLVEKKKPTGGAMLEMKKMKGESLVRCGWSGCSPENEEKGRVSMAAVRSWESEKNIGFGFWGDEGQCENRGFSSTQTRENRFRQWVKRKAKLTYG